MTGFNKEPTWRFASKARLKPVKSCVDPTAAINSPFSGWAISTAPCRFFKRAGLLLAKRSTEALKAF